MKLLLVILVIFSYSAMAEEKSKFSFGGELRERYEYYSNYLWGRPLATGDGYYLHRIMGNVGYQPTSNLKLNLQLKSNTVSDKTLSPRSIDKDELDLHQFYADWKFDTEWSFKAGRQELSYGSSRLISVREGPNVRQSFDALKVSYQSDAFVFDAFVSRPVETNPWMFDDGSDYNRKLMGLYSTYSKKIDLYYFYNENKKADFHSVNGLEKRNSLGVRFFSEKNSSLDYDWEGVWQFGELEESKINAWTVASNTGYTFKKIRVGLKANIASGDGVGGDKTLNTFNPLFPKGAYFNEAAIIGPANIMDIHPSVTISPTENVTFQADWDFMWRHSLNDGLYNISLTPSVGPDGKKREIGSQLAFSGQWKFSANALIYAQYMHFFTGSYIEDVTPGKDIDFYTMWVSYKF